MPPRNAGRVQACDVAQARGRLRDAHAEMELAGLHQAASTAEERKAATSCAVLAGIAAADAACCAALGERSRSQNHRDAANLLRQIQPEGDKAAQAFERLISLKDAAQYGFEDVSGQSLLAAKRQASALIGFAEQIVSR